MSFSHRADGMRVWLITGADQGPGAAIAFSALKSGDTVLASASDVDALHRRHGPHPGLHPVPVAALTGSRASGAVARAVEPLDRVDVLVNAAALMRPGHPDAVGSSQGMPELNLGSCETLLRMLASTRAVLPQMRQRRFGRVVNLLPACGRALGVGSELAATRFAVEAISDTVNREMSAWCIRAMTVEGAQFDVQPAGNAAPREDVEATRSVQEVL
ncbi:SDR family NAD(P)-dependent oxidoreductase, partial [Paucibacter sp. PLA-PC-4]|uniref:SDR family NAD(P)-dependent oxidoreductase n=1 Tax=Paucibacter sp. PLA-PC-4 TaxID=2993655 RepID=UPI002B05C0CD